MTRFAHLTREERIGIQHSLDEHLTLAAIARQVDKHPSTIAKEIRHHRILKPSPYWRRKQCTNMDTCTQHHLCRTDCGKACRTCPYCIRYCPQYTKPTCPLLDKAPYVCNGCTQGKTCRMDRFIYSAVVAQDQYEKNWKAARQGNSYTQNELEQMAEIVKPLLKKQSVYHIWITNRTRLFCSQRQFYRMVHDGRLKIAPLDLFKQVRYRPRRKQRSFKVETTCRQGRSYLDFIAFMDSEPLAAAVQMDTVVGCQSSTKVVLTLFFPQVQFLLIFLRNSNTAQSVLDIFNRLYDLLGHEDFCRLFPVILTDNGCEFSAPTLLETTPDGSRRTTIFYCDPGQSQQKGQIECAHKELRKIVPKGASFDALTQEHCNLIANHINSHRRRSLAGKSPIECFANLFGQAVLDKLDLAPIESVDVNLSPALLTHCDIEKPTEG